MRWSVVPCLSLLLLSGCASIVANDEVKDLQTASLAFGMALRAADDAADAALEARAYEEYRANVSAGGSVRITETCRADTVRADQAFSNALQMTPYVAANVDRGYLTFATIVPCDFEGLQPLRTAQSPDPAPQLDGSVAASGSNTLSGTAQRLDAYVTALTDVATGATAAKTDAARARLVAAGRGLFAATKTAGSADLVVDPASRAVDGIIAAKRNAVARTFLNAMNAPMPLLMERIGLAARVQHASAALNRARAAQAIAHSANLTLDAPGMVVKSESGASISSPTRMALLDETAARLRAQNAVFIALTSTDPMVAARAFANSHRALTDIYNDPSASRAALAEGLASFTAAAAALDTALTKTLSAPVSE